MNESSKDAQGHPGRHRLALVASLGAVLGLVTPRDAHCSSLHRAQVLPAAQARFRAAVSAKSIMQNALARRVEAYYQRALTARSSGVSRVAGMRYFLVANEDGTLPDSSVVQYLNWRRGLNTTRFDYNHPGIGQILRRNQLARVTPSIPVLPEIPTDTTTKPPIVISTVPSTQVPIPEPSSLLLGVILAGACAWWQRRRRNREPL